MTLLLVQHSPEWQEVFDFGFDRVTSDEAGGVLRTSSRPTLTLVSSSARLNKHSP